MTATAVEKPQRRPRPAARAGTARRPRALQTVLLPLSVLFAGVAAWEVISRAGLVNEIIVPAPSAVAQELVGMLDERYFWDATWVTLSETVAGFAIGVVLAWLIGTALGMFRTARTAFYPLVVGFQITPRVALAPLFLTWFGFGITSKIVMAATICFFPVLLNVMVGMQGVDPAARTLMRSLGASRWEEYTKLTLPHSLPLIFAGIKNAITLALIGAIVAEFVGASQGMGVLIKTLNFQLNVAAGFAVIVALMVFGLLLYWVVELVDAKVVHWRNHA